MWRNALAIRRLWDKTMMKSPIAEHCQGGFDSRALMTQKVGFACLMGFKSGWKLLFWVNLGGWKLNQSQLIIYSSAFWCSGKIIKRDTCVQLYSLLMLITHSDIKNSFLLNKAEDNWPSHLIDILNNKNSTLGDRRNPSTWCTATTATPTGRKCGLCGGNLAWVGLSSKKWNDESCVLRLP